MRILFLNSDYPEFLEQFYARQPGLEGAPYAEQLAARNATAFGSADWYSRHLKRLGHESAELHVNNFRLQSAWLRERGRVPPAIPVPAAGARLRNVRRRFSAIPGVARLHSSLFQRGTRSAYPPEWLAIVSEQIREYRPDVLINLDLAGVRTDFINHVEPFARLVVGQIASPLPAGDNLDSYDLMISAIPAFVERFRRLGIPAELSRCAFEPEILQRLGESTPTRASFVGALSPHHSRRIKWLEAVCSVEAVSVWGPGVERLRNGSPILRDYRGVVWGIDMFRVIAGSDVTLNHHIDVAGSEANNMRLFEATGVATCLITDARRNLADMFEPDVEVVTYGSPAECAEKIRYLLDHPSERADIAQAGQRRTLRDHTYAQRMFELAQLLENWL